VGGIPPAEPREFRSDIFKQTPQKTEWRGGVKYTTLTKIESNVVIKPSVQTVAKIARALGVPMEDLVK
jgi:hypothetical protein